MGKANAACATAAPASALSLEILARSALRLADRDVCALADMGRSCGEISGRGRDVADS
jgi:hypothetical protein